MSVEQQIKDTIASLKDFQRATVNVAVEKLLNGQSRFLIADEVGLGKTVVAKGIIAKLVEHRLAEKKMLHVVYICSNLALAKQNLAKLSFVKKEMNDDKDYFKVINDNPEDDRITALAYQEEIPYNKYGLYIKALTPSTSFDIGSMGKADERVLLYRILSEEPEMQSRLVALKWFLKGGKSAQNWHNEIWWIRRNKHKSNFPYRPIREEVYKLFRKELSKELDPIKFKKTYRFLNIKDTCSFMSIISLLLPKNKQDRSFYDKDKDDKFTGHSRISFGEEVSKLITELRYRLSIVCKDFLQADVFVLDEFQRFNNLIQTVSDQDDAGTFIAKSVFSKPNAKVIMLSATPFKAYTNHYDEVNGQNHFEEFKSVLSFLLGGYSKDQWDQLESNMKSYFKDFRSLDFSEEGIRKLKEVKSFIEKEYRACMARTERNLVEKFSNEKFDSSVLPMKISKEDIKDFLITDRIIKKINEVSDKKLPIPIEYVKSSPFPFSFLQDYEHMKVFEKVYEENKELKKLVKLSLEAWIPIDRVQEYKPLLPISETRKDSEPNAKLRILYNKTVRNKGWQLLWIPPSVSYYKVNKGAYVNAEDFSKTLIFSAWKMVPRMISALVSYEAERLTVGKYVDKTKEESTQYNRKDKKRFPRPLLNYRYTDRKLSGMNNLMLFYPSLYLSNIYDPSLNVYERKDLSEIRRQLSVRIKNELIACNALKLGEVDGDLQKWYWYAILLLDKRTQSIENVSWINYFLKANEDDLDSDDEKSENGSKGKLEHYLEIQRCLLDNSYVPNLSKLSKSQLDSISKHLADLVIGAPGNVCYRSLAKNYKDKEIDLCKAGFVAAQGFNSLFNKPECIAIVQQKDKFYHNAVLEYCIYGNIQSMLDEYIFQLKDSGGIYSSLSCALMVRDVMAVNSASVDVKYLDEKSKGALKSFSMRTHYSIPFGTGASSDLKAGNRQIKVRESFNSPFRPFVLTSTSIGQEGLDFHYYCSDLIHWNLPSNPIDLEQREGRIKRFRGLNIRRAIANCYLEKLENSNKLVWDELYEMAESNKEEGVCDLVPFWHIPNANKYKLKTLIPIYSYSKDYEKLKMIKSVLKNYRLTFGQPRQEELIEMINEKLNTEQIEILNKELFINLSPISFNT
jgi:hypothetical protein